MWRRSPRLSRKEAFAQPIDDCVVHIEGALDIVVERQIFFRNLIEEAFQILDAHIEQRTLGVVVQRSVALFPMRDRLPLQNMGRLGSIGLHVIKASVICGNA